MTVSRNRIVRTVIFLFSLSLCISTLLGSYVFADQLSGQVKISGSSTVYPITMAVAEEFFRQYPNVTVPVQSTGTGAGFANFFIPGKTDINAASRPIEERERKRAEQNDIQILEFKIAYDAITVIVNPRANWISDVTLNLLKRIWKPDDPVKKWSEINPDWPDQKIELYGPTSASGTFDYFTQHVIGEQGASRSDFQGTEQDNTIIQAVSRSKYALGYLGLSYYLQNKQLVKALAINGIKPSLESADSGEYPLSRPVYIYVNKNSLQREAVREFVNFYLEMSGSDLIKQIGFVPVNSDIRNNNLKKLKDAVEDPQQDDSSSQDS